MLFGIAGRKGHGKDTCADIMASTDRDNVIKVAFADPIKGACAALFGFSDAQLHDPVAKETRDSRWHISPRRAMQFLGTDLIQKHMEPLLPGIGNGFFVEAMRHRVRQMWQQNPNLVIIISDVRFQHEVDFIHELGGCVFRVIRMSMLEQSLADTHASETMVDVLSDIDEEIFNDGTPEELELAVNAAGDRLVARLAREVDATKNKIGAINLALKNEK